MKILITGGGGMVGRNILESSNVKAYRIISPSSKELNLLNRNAVYEFILKEMPDFIIHAAGRVGGIQANMANPKAFLSDNLNMGINVISAAETVGVPNLMNLASSCMYPKGVSNPLSEKMILKGEMEPTNEGYALAKAVCTRLCEHIARENPEKKYKTIIPCNLYGRHDKYEPKNSHLIPAIIRKIHDAKKTRQKSVTVWGDGLARREFMCARDLADFIFFAIEKYDRMPQNLNVGLGHDRSVKEYYQAVASTMNYSGTFKYDLSKPVGIQQKLLDITQLNKFGWRAKIKLADGINESYEYYKNIK